MMRQLYLAILALALSWLGAVARADDGAVTVLYAGSLVNVMENSVAPALRQATGLTFQGYGAGSNKLANEIRGRLRRGDVFISANAKVSQSLVGAEGGGWLGWYLSFAQSPLVIGLPRGSPLAAQFQSRPWYEVLAQPGLRLGRTDPKLDPKGALTVTLLQRAESVYDKPGLAQLILGDPEDSPQVLPEEALLGRLQSGQLDAGFFYSTETTQAHLTAIALPPEVAQKAIYSIGILQGAANPAGAERFVAFLLGESGRALLAAQGLDLLPPTLSGDPAALPVGLAPLLDAGPRPR